jgi:hypothetical protein
VAAVVSRGQAFGVVVTDALDHLGKGHGLIGAGGQGVTFVIAAPPSYRGLKLRAGRKTYTTDVAPACLLWKPAGPAASTSGAIP